MAMIIVARIVTDAPVTFDPISPKSVNDTLPHNNTIKAPIVAGIASFNPIGLQKIKIIVMKKASNVNILVNCVIYFTSLSIILKSNDCHALTSILANYLYCMYTYTDMKLY
ncbi:hypothetical protein BSF_35450 [Bacillus subtilis]|nr:hypothetical protein BSF_35450 [Bacillus subtilis]